MLQKKICMLGAFAVGKTSLVRRYVESIYSDAYHTTVGVKISNKVVQANNSAVNLVLWDLYGEDDFQKMNWKHLQGAFGYLLVADGTRPATLDKALALEQKARAEIGSLPFVFVVNKCDLVNDWQFDATLEAQLVARNWTILRSSAKTGEGVEEAFSILTGKMLG
jgi:small GTP-binding protein